MFESEGYCGTSQLLVLTVTQILATQLDPRVSLEKKNSFSVFGCGAILRPLLSEQALQYNNKENYCESESEERENETNKHRRI